MWPDSGTSQRYTVVEVGEVGRAQATPGHLLCFVDVEKSFQISNKEEV